MSGYISAAAYSEKYGPPQEPSGGGTTGMAWWTAVTSAVGGNLNFEGKYSSNPRSAGFVPLGSTKSYPITWLNRSGHTLVISDKVHTFSVDNGGSIDQEKTGMLTFGGKSTPNASGTKPATGASGSVGKPDASTKADGAGVGLFFVIIVIWLLSRKKRS